MASPSSAPEYISKVRDAYTPFRLPKLYPMGEDDQSPPSESVASFFPGHEYLTPSPDLLNYRMWVFSSYLKWNAYSLPEMKCLEPTGQNLNRYIVVLKSPQ